MIPGLPEDSVERAIALARAPAEGRQAVRATSQTGRHLANEAVTQDTFYKEHVKTNIARLLYTP